MRHLIPILLSFLFSVHTLHAHSDLLLGCERTELYVPRLRGQRVAVFSNQTGCNQRGKHTLDVLLEHGINVTTLFGPEHGFRGTADAGERVSSSVDPQTGIPISSLYDGGKKGPKDEVMNRFDVLVVDIQDVGLRFYTYYISMLKLMNRCGQMGRTVVILDRPNPNGHYVDGPILDMNLSSGVGALPIPIVHGLTLGELALMVQGEDWVEHPCNLVVIPCSGYTHQTPYELPIPPSPNLPNQRSVYLYSSLCYFEGTCVSLGRGTKYPFQIYGHPDMKDGPLPQKKLRKYLFRPESRPGAKNPPLLNEDCVGVSLRRLPMKDLYRRGRIDLTYLLDAYRRLDLGEDFFLRKGDFFDKLMGRTYVREMILRGASAEEIRATWQQEVGSFIQQRRPYLIYPE